MSKKVWEETWDPAWFGANFADPAKMRLASAAPEMARVLIELASEDCVGGCDDLSPETQARIRDVLVKAGVQWSAPSYVQHGCPSCGADEEKVRSGGVLVTLLGWFGGADKDPNWHDESCTCDVCGCRWSRCWRPASKSTKIEMDTSPGAPMTSGSVLLQKWMLANEVSQPDLARRVGRSQTTVSAWVRGRRPTLEDAAKLKEVCGIDPGEWMRLEVAVREWKAARGA